MRPGFGDDGVCALQRRCLVAVAALAAVTFLARTLLHVVRRRMGGVAPTPVWAKPLCHPAGAEILAEPASPPLAITTRGVCCRCSDRGDRDMTKSGSSHRHLSRVALAPTFLPCRGLCSRVASWLWRRPAVIASLTAALAWATVLAALCAAPPAHAADGAAAAPQVPLAAWPLRPLSPEEERALQPASQFQECTSCPQMVVIPAGQFLMGSSRGEG